MKGKALIGLGFLLAFAVPVLSDIPRPEPRPAELAAPEAATAPERSVPTASTGAAVASEGSPQRSIRPPRRKADAAEASSAAPSDRAPPSETQAMRATMNAAALPLRSIRPPPRPAAAIAAAAAQRQTQQRAAAAQPAAPAPPESRSAPRGNIFSAIFGGGRKSEPQRSRRGSVCGDPAIRGESVPRITGRVGGCGIEEPVRVTEVDGVRLSTAATLDCDTAKALRFWVTNGLKPAFGRNEVSTLRIAAHYACRTRNNRPGARISEHGRGKAIDIASIILADGREISILRDYRSRAGAPVRQAHKAACGPFGTTLGPGSDRYHNDHLHFDTASHRSGPYCR
ncbi:extensin family protein [Szabonella alba]|uniref:Extensin family protein n=1 Tax=Szabonella alba TaxID=2804194 RepID=A0A8K0VAU9_9RHOB|nr:extensin family protein [Szabonella alba]MBL4916394.1 extensin family protein [Szabonella alba]